MLAILWELNPGHELLLPAYIDGRRELTSYVRKPFFGREGQGIAVIRDGSVVEGAPGSGNADNCVYHALAPMAADAGKIAVSGS